MMRYSKEEETVLVGMFPSNSVVKIKIINLLNDSIVSLSDENCIESRHIDGAFIWPTRYIKDAALSNGFYNLLYEMYDTDNNKFHGKFIYGGYVDREVIVDTTDLNLDLTEIKEMTELINARI